MSPDKKYGPIVADIFHKYCQEIFKETRADGIRLTASFIFRNGKGDLKLKSFITPDGKTERMMDTEVLMPRGTKLAHDAFRKMRTTAKRVGVAKRPVKAQPKGKK